jgi:hypothetical protein
VLGRSAEPGVAARLALPGPELERLTSLARWSARQSPTRRLFREGKGRLDARSFFDSCHYLLGPRPQSTTRMLLQHTSRIALIKIKVPRLVPGVDRPPLIENAVPYSWCPCSARSLGATLCVFARHHYSLPKIPMTTQAGYALARCSGGRALRQPLYKRPELSMSIGDLAKCSNRLARPTGIEPVFPP